MKGAVTKMAIGGIAAVLLAVAAFLLMRNNLPVSPPVDAQVVIDAPTVNEVIRSPLAVKGKARGSWFFEANIRVSLIDEKGDVVAASHGMAEGEWMTPELVPFSATVRFSPPATETGILRIMNDNPSGLPENDKSFDVPVRFAR